MPLTTEQNKALLAAYDAVAFDITEHVSATRSQQGKETVRNLRTTLQAAIHADETIAGEAVSTLQQEGIKWVNKIAALCAAKPDICSPLQGLINTGLVEIGDQTARNFLYTHTDYGNRTLYRVPPFYIDPSPDRHVAEIAEGTGKVNGSGPTTRSSGWSR